MPMAMAAVDGVATRGAGFAGGVERLRLGLLWLAGFSGGFVLIEPAPYEIVVALAIVTFALTGLQMRAAHVPLLVLFAASSTAYFIGVLPVINADNAVKWTLVSSFLVMTSLFFAMAMTENTERRLNKVLAGYLAGALIVSAIGILAYFRLIPFTDVFLYAGRARATFKDPNVLGPFLVLPALIVMGRLLWGQSRGAVRSSALLLVILLSLLLTFSRGAWGHFIASAALLMALGFLTSRTGAVRKRIIAFAIIGAAALALFLAAILSIKAVGDLFQERASLIQYYDEGPLGRFGRHVLGFELMLDHPIGIGALQFIRYFPEDPHNSFLDAFVAGGWLGGVTYITLIAVTLVFGLRHVFVRSRWQNSYIALYATFVAEAAESYIIDVQHWRHFFLIIGLLWGLMAARGARQQIAPRGDAQYSPTPFGA